MRLNLGCGYRKPPGFINEAPVSEPDMQLALTRFHTVLSDHAIILRAVKP